MNGARHAMLAALALVGMLVLPAPAGAQADYAREKRWADEITPAILVGDPVYLALPSGQRFLAIYTPSPKARAGVIVVHGIGVHPDWGLINTLRSELPERGYSTLSVQMPVLAADARPDAYAPLFPEAGERLRAAVEFLRARGERSIAIVSHSLGSRMVDGFLAGKPGGVDAWVSIGLTGSYSRPAALTMPVLDVYGERDLPGVLNAAEARAAALPGARRTKVAGADHFYDGRGAELLEVVRGFLDGQFGR